MVDVEPLRHSLSELIVEAQRLGGDVRAAEESRRRENMINMVLSLVGVVLFVLVLLVAWQNNRLSAQNRVIADQIRSCTTPEGQCYRDSNKRTSGAVQQIILAQIYVVQCAKGAKDDAEVEACVARKIQERKS